MFALSAGQMIADKYRIDAIVGSGGMGVVVAATHVDLGQRVAIKLLRDAGDEAVARFRREARLLVKLKSPHAARVFDVGALDDDTPYIVMELLEGEDLGAVVKARGRLGVHEVTDHVLEAICAVAEAHTLGMVHRDLKPANLFLAKGPGGTPAIKVLDFGISKILDDGQRGQDVTNEGVALGSPGYMAPEQMESSRDVDTRADVFSLGAILYRLVSGRTPYQGASIVSVLAAMATERLPPLVALAPDVPPAFATVVERCLAKDRAYRWPTVAHLARALAPWSSRRGQVALDAILATMPIRDSEVDPLGATLARPLEAPKKKPSRAPLLVTLALLATTAAIALGLRTTEVPQSVHVPVPVPVPDPPSPPSASASASAPAPAPASATASASASAPASAFSGTGTGTGTGTGRKPPHTRQSTTGTGSLLPPPDPAELPPDRH